MKLNTIKQVRYEFTQLAKQLNIVHFEDWYNVSWPEVKQLTTSKTLQSATDVTGWLIVSFPEHTWYRWRFKNFPVSKHFWSIHENQRRFFNELEKKLKLNSLCELSTTDICEEGGKEILTYYNNSLSECINSLFPERELKVWNFKQVKKGYWDSIQNQRFFMEELIRELGYTTWEDLYQIKGEDIVKFGGGTLLNRYGDSLVKTISSIFPEREWIAWRFKHANVDSSVWKDFHSQKHFLEELATKMHVKDMEDWYAIPNIVFYQHGGSGLLRLFGNSRYNLFSHVFPQYPWKRWKFFVESSMKKQSFFWKDIENQRSFLFEFSKKYKINQLGDWFDIKVVDVVKNGGSGLLRYYNYSLLKALSNLYPSFSKYIIKKSRSLPKSKDSKKQMSLFHSLRNINFTHLFNKINHLHESSLSSEIEIFLDFVLTDGNKSIEVDIAIPSLKMAFEYQGEQHDAQYSIVGDNYLPTRQKLDFEKVQVCKRIGYLLIPVDHLWDGSSLSLSKLISQHLCESSSK